METVILTCLQVQLLIAKINSKSFLPEIKIELIRELKKTSPQECGIINKL